MIFEVKNVLEEHGAEPAGKIHYELFTAPGAARKAPTADAARASDAFDASITVIQDGMQFDFQLQSDGSTLLDAAMRAGADLPFSCKGGVCSTCKAKMLEGEADMELCYGLEPDEVEAGYVLTCQSHPKTKRSVAILLLKGMSTAVPFPATTNTPRSRRRAVSSSALQFSR